MKRYSYIVLMMVVLLWTGCESEGMNEPKQEDSFTLSLCLPADEVHMTPLNGPKHVMGDPGSAELMELPKYVYIFIVKEFAADNWKVWEIIEEKPSSENWEKQYYSGPLMGDRDSVYRYSKRIVLPLGSKFNGRIYSIASAKKLTFDATISCTAESESTEAELLALKFLTSPDSIQQNLQNIYSTPCNYEVDDKYYGSFSGITHNVPTVYLMLYHVAAKVDITWNVADSARVKSRDENPIRLTKLEACNLFNHDAYCFKPMANKMESPLISAAGKGDTIKIVSADDEGLWWEGRSYFYTIPYTTTGKAGYFPLQMRMETNGSGEYYRPTIYLNVSSDDTFVPWLRATFNIKSPLTAGTAVKTVD